jgi:hypothetical protein
MKIDDSFMIGESFHTQHICLKEDRAKIVGTYFIIEVFRPMKAEAI